MSGVSWKSQRSWMKKLLKRIVPSRVFLHAGDHRVPAVALTFDDGPVLHQTEAILEVLKKENVRATFFVVGKAAETHPEIIQRIYKEGHQLGNHSYSHVRLGRSRYRIMKEEFEKTQKIIEKIIGYSPKILRSPFGQTTLGILWYSFLHRLRFISWSLDTGDSVENTANEVFERIRSHPIRPGDIILCHDDSRFILEILPIIISSVRTRRLFFCTIDEL